MPTPTPARPPTRVNTKAFFQIPFEFFIFTLFFIQDSLISEVSLP